MADVIFFKTKSPFFEKERDDLKCNTVRKVFCDNDSRYDTIMAFIQGEITDLDIKIKNPKTKEEFKRKVTDITYWDEHFIISWRPSKS